MSKQNVIYINFPQNGVSRIHYSELQFVKIYLNEKNQVIYLLNLKLPPNVSYKALKKEIYFSALNIGKKASSFWDIDCKSLTD